MKFKEDATVRMRLNYRLVGAGGPPILLIHGFGSDAAETWGDSGWSGNAALEGRTLVLPDLRGHGRSPRPMTAAAYSADILLADILSVIGQMDAGPVDVVGYSIGARIGALVAVRAPELVRRLVVGGVGATDQVRHRDPRGLFGMLARPEAAPPEMSRLLESIRRRPTDQIRALAACFDGVSEIPLPEHVPVPALVFAGTDDNLATGAEQLAASWDASFLAVRGRHHADTLSAPELIWAVSEFLSNGTEEWETQ